MNIKFLKNFSMQIKEERGMDNNPKTKKNYENHLYSY